MTPSTDRASPWGLFQHRVKTAISRAATQHETVESLLVDLRRCEVALRGAEDLVGCLEGAASPVAIELRAALKEHREEDPVQFDGTCAANIVLAVMNAFVNASERV